MALGMYGGEARYIDGMSVEQLETYLLSKDFSTATTDKLKGILQALLPFYIFLFIIPSNSFPLQQMKSMGNHFFYWKSLCLRRLVWQWGPV